MVYHLTLESNNSDLPSKPERALIEDTEARIVEAVVLLTRNCPPHNLPEKAREELLTLKPRLGEALEALEDLKGRRSLTERERSREYAFRMLLACRV